jgi:hypothetical protein
MPSNNAATGKFYRWSTLELGSEPMTTADEYSVKTWWEKKIERARVHHVFLVLCVLGGLLLWFIPPGRFLHSLGEAVFIAGLLVLFVDPMLKGRLLREASRGIFHYLLGFDQQPEIRDRLKSLVFDTKIFRRNFYAKCVFAPQNDSMILDLDCSFEVVNPTNEAQRFRHVVQCERVEKPTIHLMTLISEQENYSRTPPLNDKADDPVVLEGDAGEIEIQPSKKGLTYRFGTKFSMVYPKEFFYSLHVGVPTIGITVEVDPPAGFEVTVSPTPICAKNLWKHDRLFMPGEHVDVRWQRSTDVPVKPSPVL